MSAVTADRLSWMWVDKVRPSGLLIAVRTQGVPGYRYWTNTGGGWMLHAEVHNEADSVTWYAHRVDPTPAPVEVAGWLDTVAKEVQ